MRMTCAPQSSKVGRVSHMKICMTAVHQPMGILISSFVRTTGRFCNALKQKVNVKYGTYPGGTKRTSLT